MLKQITISTIDIYGADDSNYKLKMDTIRSTLLAGRTTKVLLTYLNDYQLAYQNAYARSISTNEDDIAIFDAIYSSATQSAAEGFQVYTDFLIELEARILMRTRDLLDRVEKYYNEGAFTGSGLDTNKITFWNYESVLDAYDALEDGITDLHSGSSLDQKVLLTIQDAIENANDRGGGVTYNYETLRDETWPSLAEVTAQATRARQYYNQALDFYNHWKSFRDGLVNQNKDNVGGDYSIMSSIMSGGSQYPYGWVKGIGRLNVTQIQAICESVGLLEDADIYDLMDNAINDLDAMLLSRDVANLLDRFLTSEDPETGEKISFLGQWEYDYTEINGTRHIGRYYTDSSGNFQDRMANPSTASQINKIENMREFLINTILKLLYGGSLQTSAMKLIYPMVFNLVGNPAEGGPLYGDGGIAPGGSLNVPILGDIHLSVVIPDLMATAIPIMPHHFYWNAGNPYNINTNTDAQNKEDCIWYKFFNGDFFGGNDNALRKKYDYTKVLDMLSLNR